MSDESAATTVTRTKTVSWSDPAVSAAAAKTMAGLDFLHALVDGTLPPPPILALMNLEAVGATTGEVTFRCTPDESHYNPIGTVHGGFVCTVLDSVLGCAVQSTLPAGTGYTSLEIKVNYLRPLSADSGELTAIGRVTKPGRRAAFAEGEVRDAAGRLIATASSTLLVFAV
ncbi:aromatic compound degradation protein PaaI [Frondihabitans sucicola]|uniref:Aromatic compound degradation protein PaaI n=1 Tax=Frondihabitans sucicola TaxID=1268041 RepID=A0ABM8GJ85_9MICO|nr:PaaI family thioesterase [Frondihabitans sucicola]BDZ48450.1 aromatic compound degradation protein PaaI [Frondihabitans sucicola]